MLSRCFLFRALPCAFLFQLSAQAKETDWRRLGKTNQADMSRAWPFTLEGEYPYRPRLFYPAGGTLEDPAIVRRIAPCGTLKSSILRGLGKLQRRNRSTSVRFVAQTQLAAQPFSKTDRNSHAKAVRGSIVKCFGHALTVVCD